MASRRSKSRPETLSALIQMCGGEARGVFRPRTRQISAEGLSFPGWSAVILTSGYPVNLWNDRDSEDLERLGPSSVTMLEKPFRAQTFLDAVHALIGEPVPAKKVKTA